MVHHHHQWLFDLKIMNNSTIPILIRRYQRRSKTLPNNFISIFIMILIRLKFWQSVLELFTVQRKDRKWAARRNIIKPTPFFYFSFINKLCTEKGVRYRKTPFPLHVFTFYAHFKGVVLRIICTKKYTPLKSINDEAHF